MTFSLANPRTLGNVTDRTIVRLLDIADSLHAELVQSTSFSYAQHPLSLSIDAWETWKDNLTTFFAHLVVTQDYCKPPVLETASRMLMWVESHCNHIRQGRLMTPTVTKEQVNKLEERVCRELRIPPRSSVNRDFYSFLYNCNFSVFLREAFLHQFPKQSKEASSTSMAESMINTSYLEKMQRDLLLHGGESNNALLKIAQDKNSHLHDILILYLFGHIFNINRMGYPWLKHCVVTHVEWPDRHGSLSNRFCTDPDLQGRNERPLIISLLGRWVVWVYVPGESVPRIYDCGLASIAVVQWLSLMNEFFENRMEDSMSLPPELVSLLSV